MYFHQLGVGQPRLLALLLLVVLATTCPAVSQAPPGSAEAAASEAAYQQFGQPVGSMLRQYEQCGGAGGLCNQTTIGVPCGDLVWRGVSCPEAFSCQRQNSTAWVCLPAPPGSPEANAAASRNSSSTAENATLENSRGDTPEDAAVSDEVVNENAVNENAAGGSPLSAPGAASSSTGKLGMPSAGGGCCLWLLAVQAAAAVMAAVLVL